MEKTYLISRIYKVRLNNKQTSWEKVTCGISLGGLWAVLLLLIYINDLPDGCKPLQMETEERSCRTKCLFHRNIIRKIKHYSVHLVYQI